LADALGDDHDLALLQAALQATPPDQQPVRGDLMELIAERRDNLRAEAQAIGGRLYADKPSVFTDRIGGWYRRWRQEAARELVGAAAN
jgi:hypothetical protein